MKSFITFFILISIFFFIPILTNAQQSTLSSGGNAFGINGSMSYSIGQTIFTRISGTNGALNQGVQQPYEISVVIGVNDFNSSDMTFMLFPNPVTDQLTIKIDKYDHRELYLKLFTVDGECVIKEKQNDIVNSINLIGLPPSIYFLKISDNQKEFVTYKIIKY